jgi:signal transduction histidine kinase
MNFSRLSKNRLFARSLVSFALILSFSTFRWSEAKQKISAENSIKTLLRNEAASSNIFELSKSILDLQRIGLVNCAKLFDSFENDNPFFNSVDAGMCSDGLLGRFASRDFRIRGVNGHTYKVEIQLPVQWQSIILEIAVYLLLALVWLEVERRIREQSFQEKIANALMLQRRQVAHDIRAPLAALKAVEATFESLPEDARPLIVGALSRISAITSELLKKDVSLDPTAGVSDLQVFSIESAIKQIIEEKIAQYGAGGQLSLELVTEKPGIYTDARVRPVEIMRMFSNLIDNAIEASQGDPKVTILIRREKAAFRVLLADSGKGIDKDVLSKLGQLGETHGKSGGSGLGLFHAKNTMEGIGGSLLIESTVNKGTTVILTFPDQPRSVKDDLPGEILNQLHVLLDNDVLIRKIWKMAAKKTKTQLQTFETAADLFAVVRKLDATTIFYLDFDLGGNESGANVGRQLSEMGFTEIYLATGHSASSFPKMEWIKGFVGKEPPWLHKN